MRKVIILLLTLITTAACAAGPSPVQAPHITDNLTTATELARRQLGTELQLDAATIQADVEVISSEAQIWPDSSLGCGKRGSMAMQVITNGYAFLFKTPRGNYRVHATERFAVVCGPAIRRRDDNQSPRQSSVPMGPLDEKIEMARVDLASRLNVDPTLIRTLRFDAIEWPDSSMACAVADETTRVVLTKGYRIALSYRGRVYAYHTDLERMRACPSVDSK
jgi:hypothetical protein